MIAVLAFHPGDQDLALKNAIWINELGGCKGHEILCCYDMRCTPQTVEEIGKELRNGFDRVWRIKAEAAIDGWPEGANYLWGLCLAWLQGKQEWPYFLWLEPDAVPLIPGWMDKLEAEYKRAGKPFMGDRVQVEDIPLHMSGVGIYQNPIYLNAGEAFRAHEIAWDMAAKDQIVPKAHFTDLIEHAWRHPTFKDQYELNTQIAKETILFHSSKDGSLIDRLREKAAPVHNQNSVATEPTSDVHSSREEIGTRPAQPPPELVYDIFIRTYPGDYEWLFHSLKSIKKYVTGFRKIWIASPSPCPWANMPAHIEWKVMNDETEDGYLAQQITKLYADVITDYQADYILHVDSDIVFTRLTTPGDFFQDGKLIWYYTPYENIQTPWQPITEKFLGQALDYEYMRRLPMMMPRWLYPKLREYCHTKHGKVISEYIRMQPERAFSEFNALGAYAYFNHHEKFNWRHTQEEGPMPYPLALQFHSWGGLTPEVKREIETILGGDAVATSTGLPTINAPPTVPPAGGAIKELPNGVWVLEGDQISEWVEQEGRLDHDQNLLPDILRHIKPGDTVVDCGAFIGDHTIAYANAVGETGMVYACEPNPISFECLRHNVTGKQVWLSNMALGDSTCMVPLSGNNGNAGGCYIGEHMKVCDVTVTQLDYSNLKPNLIKIDVEGYELKVLRGAQKTIEKHHPVMVIEINSEALARQDDRPGDVLSWLENHGYDYSIIQENCGFTDPLYDILAIAKQPPEISSDDGPAHSESPAVTPPVDTLTIDNVRNYIDALKAFADSSPKARARVHMHLVYAKLRQPNPKNKHDPKKFFTYRPPYQKRKQPDQEHTS